MTEPANTPQHASMSDKITRMLRERLGSSLNNFLIPPPIFTFMDGEFVDFDPDQAWLKVRFPVRYDYLNPYRTMQGGMIAAAIDNTLGPLSSLIAPPNVTRNLELKYSAPIPLSTETILVFAQLVERSGRELFFKAEVRTEEGKLLARAKARHWIN